MTISASTAIDRILVPFDGEPASLGMLEYALSMSNSFKHVTVLLLDRVIEPGMDQIEANICQILARYSSMHPTVSVVHATPGEDLTESILTKARRLRSNFIVLAMQDQDTGGHALGRARMVSEAVALAADIPVMALRPEVVEGERSCAALRRILVPLDASAASRQALPVATALAREFGVPLQLVTVIDPARVLPAAYAYMPESDPDRCDAIASLEYQANQLLNRVESALRTTGIDASSALLYGSTQQCLLSAIQQGDLVVMTTHGEGKGVQSRFGSVAFGIVRQSPQPVVVLHSPASKLAEEYGRASWEFDSGAHPSLCRPYTDLPAAAH